MATDVTTSLEAIARQFADAIRDEPAVEQLWLVSDPDGAEVDKAFSSQRCSQC